MIPVINVRHDTKRIVAELRADREHARKAQVRSLNRTVEQLRTASGREIRKEYNVTLRGVRQASKITRARLGQRFARAELTFSGRPINLYEFSARQVRKGVTVRIKVKGPRKLLRSAFIQTLKSGPNAGNRGVFRRVGKARYPIRFMPSISIPQMTEVRAVSGALLLFAGVRYEMNLRHELEFLARRA